MKRLILLILLILPCIASSDKNACEIYLYINPGEEFPAMYIPYQGIPPEMKKVIVTDSMYYLMNIRDCRGEMSLRAYCNGQLRIEGNYVNAPDTFKTNVAAEDPSNPGVQITGTLDYFQPLKDSTWTYYNNSGKLVREENWTRGVQKNELIKTPAQTPGNSPRH